MSRINGDKARFNRERKQNIQRRKRNKALFLAAEASVGKPGVGKKPAAVSETAKSQA